MGKEVLRLATLFHWGVVFCLSCLSQRLPQEPMSYERLLKCFCLSALESLFRFEGFLGRGYYAASFYSISELYLTNAVR